MCHRGTQSAVNPANPFNRGQLAELRPQWTQIIEDEIRQPCSIHFRYLVHFPGLRWKIFYKKPSSRSPFLGSFNLLWNSEPLEGNLPVRINGRPLEGQAVLYILLKMSGEGGKRDKEKKKNLPFAPRWTCLHFSHLICFVTASLLLCILGTC